MTNQEKIPLEIIKKLPIKSLMRLINYAKHKIKNDEVWIKICQEYNESPDIIDLIPTCFGDLEVSAKTDHGVVILNYQLLCDGDFTDDHSYLIHEYRHWFQQTHADKPTQSADDGEYLQNPFEQEAFQDQVEFIANHKGKEEAENYVKDLLEHHEVTNKKKKDELENIFLEKI